MIRDTTKDESYYTALITQLKSRMQKYEAKLSELSDDWVKYQRCQTHLLGIYYSLISALYSNGEPIENIKLIVKKYLASITPSSISYNVLIDSYSLAILFDLNDLPEAIVQSEKYQDSLLGILQSHAMHCKVEREEGNVLFKQYQPFFDYYIEKIDLQSFILYIDEKWYDSCSDCAWYESDKNPNNTYTGYWCWLASALLKIKGVSLKTDCRFIPSDF